MKKILSMVLVSILLSGIITTSTFGAESFSDIPDNAYYKNDLDYMMKDSRKIFEGFADGTFKPENPFTLAQLMKCIAVARNDEIPERRNGEKWYIPYVKTAIMNGWLSGGEFELSDYERAAKRGEMAMLLVRAFGEYSFREANKVKTLIKDYNAVPDKYKPYVIKSYDIGLIGGYSDGSFGAEDNLVRAQAVAIIRRFIDPSARLKLELEGVEADNTPDLSDLVYRINPDIPQELYEYEYRKSEITGFIGSNKWSVERYGLKKVTEFMNIGKRYMETFYNVDYRTYDKAQYIEKLKWFFMPQTRWRADDGITRPIEEHIQYWADMVEEKNISIKSEFITDPSLVYAAHGEVVRGQLNFSVKSCSDMQWLKNYTMLGNVTLNKEYTCAFEVELVNMELKEGWEHASRVMNNEYLLTEVSEVD
ncbi:S-layer family protein [Anaerobacterium chartisolvens]|uniref:S-layer family protein n=1 Tax=Anaerobacterium chartisolvens TaxID=1297424 RepID=A0A369AUY9_9FIRM|nr:S-layer homology domain-containing protein [Anaerobacterium chartisolvens]RCX13021.1 S-layer family protein [Anaerobacterium chartisolvens]